ncbi:MULTISPECIES: hypothetical protein [Chitinophagaceae]
MPFMEKRGQLRGGYIGATVSLLILLIYGCSKENSVDTIVTPTTDSNAYVTRFFEFNPAPGQFVNTSLGDDSMAKAILGSDQGLLSLGAWGGYVVYGFDHTVLDQDGPDILVVGNALATFAEPGIVWGMRDENSNGKPDDTWYELAGSETGRDGYIRNYSVTYSRPQAANGDVSWKDNQGNSGKVLVNQYHTQNYYPDNIKADSYTLTGTLLPSSGIDMTNPAFILSIPFAYGYCDNTVGGDSVDIAHAIDAQGNTVQLKGIDFIKIQTGVLANMGWLGELSTEVSAIADIRLLKK